MQISNNPVQSVPQPRSRRLAYEFFRLILLIVLTSLAILGGMQTADPVVRFGPHDPEAEWMLSGFRDAEHNETDQYRWSGARGAVQLGPLARTPILLSLRIASPRPYNGGKAETRIEIGEWRSEMFVVPREWRRYHLVLPSTSDSSLALRVKTFQIDDNDKNSFGVMLSRVYALPLATTSWYEFGRDILGPWRLIILALTPLICYLAGQALLGVFRIRHEIPLFVAGSLGLAGGLAAIVFAAAYPLMTAWMLREEWLMPIVLISAVLVRGTLFPWLRSYEQRALVWISGEQQIFRLTMAVALAQGLIYLMVLPPWQHYDEPAHFEYAWLIANHPEWPEPGTTNPAISYLGGEGRALEHPPTYHALVGLALRLARSLPITQQLYVARSISLALFLFTIAVIAWAMRELLPPEHRLRGIVPLVAALIPPFADSMTGVNNDVGAVAAFSLFLWLAIRTIRRGLTWQRAVGIAGTALLCALTKNTAGVALLLAPIACLIAFWSQGRWQWRGLVGPILLLLVILPLPAIGWGDAAYWYRWAGTSRSPITRMSNPQAQFGSSILRIEARPIEALAWLVNPVKPQDLQRVAGRDVTVGAWVWANRTAATTGPGVLFNEGNSNITRYSPTITVTTTPTFMTWTFQAPEKISALNYLVSADLPAGEEPLEVYVDGAVMALGKFPANSAPVFDGPDAQSGVWGGQRFVNLVRNPSAEQAWPYVQPWFARLAETYIRRFPSQILTALLDIERTGEITLVEIAPWVAYASFGTFAWSQVALEGDIWRYLIWGIWGIALLGCSIWLFRSQHKYAVILPALVFLGLAGVIVWGNTILRILPMLQTSPPPFPRYGFPAILPTALALAGGWWSLWPRRIRCSMLKLAIAGLLLLNLIAVQTIIIFYIQNPPPLP